MFTICRSTCLNRLQSHLTRWRNVSLTRLLNTPTNERVLEYSIDSNSDHQLELERCLRDLQNEIQDVPIVIRGKEYRTNNIQYQKVPFDHAKNVAQFYYASHDMINEAINAALEAKEDWEEVPLSKKVDLFNKAADLVAGKYRQRLNAATMMGQAKTIKQAEIDAAAELADFLRFNAHYAKQMAELQPNSVEFENNCTRFRGLDGFIAAISPFNFTAIGANLATAPTLLGNCVVWKPSDTAVLSNYVTLKLLQEAGFPDGVINFVPSEGFDFGRLITGNRKLAGINFTGSLVTFQWLWSEVGSNIKNYTTFPRLVGECGGKNYHLVHKSANVDVVVAQTIRSAFEYSGQKCSACSRLYVPASLWPDIKEKLVAFAKERIKIGPATDFSTYTSAVIDANAFKRISSYLNYAKASKFELNVLCGGEASNEVGYFIQPTIIETSNPRNRIMQDEIFGPVLTTYVYPDAELDKIMELINENQYALTGSIFAQDENFVETAKRKLRMSAGNMYINDKSTGAVVGQQPFGGGKLSGTNDKAGGPHYLMRWCNQQTIKTTTKPMTCI